MKKKFYHGAMIEDANKIIECGYINAGCICDDKNFASGYARGNGYCFTVYQNWPIVAIIQLLFERSILSLFSFSESYSEWLYDKGIIPHNCTEYVNEPWSKTGIERRLKVQKYERILTTAST